MKMIFLRIKFGPVWEFLGSDFEILYIQFAKLSHISHHLLRKLYLISVNMNLQSNEDGWYDPFLGPLKFYSKEKLSKYRQF